MPVSEDRKNKTNSKPTSTPPTLVTAERAGAGRIRELNSDSAKTGSGKLAGQQLEFLDTQ